MHSYWLTTYGYKNRSCHLWLVGLIDW
jgi:hypothetical protein